MRMFETWRDEMLKNDDEWSTNAMIYATAVVERIKFKVWYRRPKSRELLNGDFDGGDPHATVVANLLHCNASSGVPDEVELEMKRENHFDLLLPPPTPGGSSLETRWPVKAKHPSNQVFDETAQQMWSEVGLWDGSAVELGNVIMTSNYQCIVVAIVTGRDGSVWLVGAEVKPKTSTDLMVFKVEEGNLAVYEAYNDSLAAWFTAAFKLWKKHGMRLVESGELLLVSDAMPMSSAKGRPPRRSRQPAPAASPAPPAPSPTPPAPGQPAPPSPAPARGRASRARAPRATPPAPPPPAPAKQRRSGGGGKAPPSGNPVPKKKPKAPGGNSEQEEEEEEIIEVGDVVWVDGKDDNGPMVAMEFVKNGGWWKCGQLGTELCNVRRAQLKKAESQVPAPDFDAATPPLPDSEVAIVQSPPAAPSAPAAEAPTTAAAFAPARPRAPLPALPPQPSPMSHSSELDADPEIAAARRRVEVAQEKHKILAELALAAQQTEAENARLVAAAAGLAVADATARAPPPAAGAPTTQQAAPPAPLGPTLPAAVITEHPGDMNRTFFHNHNTGKSSYIRSDVDPSFAPPPPPPPPPAHVAYALPQHSHAQPNGPPPPPPPPHATIPFQMHNTTYEQAVVGGAMQATMRMMGNLTR